MHNRQYHLGLGMMAADVLSDLTKDEREAAIVMVCNGTDVPLEWQGRITSYLTTRLCVRKGTTTAVACRANAQSYPQDAAAWLQEASWWDAGAVGRPNILVY